VIELVKWWWIDPKSKPCEWRWGSCGFPQDRPAEIRCERQMEKRRYSGCEPRDLRTLDDNQVAPFLLVYRLSLRFMANPTRKKEVPSMAAPKKATEATEKPNVN